MPTTGNRASNLRMCPDLNQIMTSWFIGATQAGLGSLFDFQCNNNIMSWFLPSTRVSRVGFMDKQPGNHVRKGLVFGLMLCCCCIEILGFWTGGPTFLFCIGPWKWNSQSFYWICRVKVIHTIDRVLGNFYLSIPPDLKFKVVNNS